MSLTLLLGGVRSGKSARALQLARAFERDASGAQVLFVATAQAFDDEMTQRIVTHRDERNFRWQTLEEPLDLAQKVASHLDSHTETSVVVIDCMTLWVSNLLLNSADESHTELAISTRVRELISVIEDYPTATTSRGAIERHWIVVSNEVGLGIVPPTPLGRAYRDALGRGNQLLAAAATAVTLMVAGIEMRIK